jgi:hypothetical protein
MRNSYLVMANVPSHDAQVPTLYDPEEDPDFGISADRLEIFVPELSEPENTALQVPSSVSRSFDVGLQGILEHLAPNYTDLHFPTPLGLEVDPSNNWVFFDLLQLRDKASASFHEHEVATKGQNAANEDWPEMRHDSHQESESVLPLNEYGPSSPQGLWPLKLDWICEPTKEDFIATSPTLSKHIITTGPETLPALQHNLYVRESAAGLTYGASLPPIQQIVSPQPLKHLDKLSKSLEQESTRSPGIPHYPYHGSTPMSPTSGFVDHCSPRTGYSRFLGYDVPPATSDPTESATAHSSSMPSTSSSNELYGRSSLNDGYSTAHTTPIDPSGLTPQPMLPPSYKCDVPGCIAPPFQTQYLLRFGCL